jgi:ferredoxin
MVSELRADRALCRGAGQCAWGAPELFDQDEAEGLVIVLRPSPAGDQLPLARRAVRTCPNRAISLSEP